MIRSVVEFCRRGVRRMGFDIQRYPDPGPLAYYFKMLNIETILDVGANEGYYGRWVRTAGFKGRIVSFEPLSQPFGILQAGCQKDPRWECHQFALGEENTELEITASTSTVFSSFLKIDPSVAAIQPHSKPERKELVRVRTLRDCFAELKLGGQTLWLKSDTQGYELQVLRGAGDLLREFRAVQVEMSLRPIYEGQVTFETVIAFMRERGFVVSDLLRGFCNGRCGELIEVDGVFVRP